MRLLLVEDDDRVAAAQQLVLRRHGIDVTRSSTASRAMELLRPAPDAFDVIVLDLGLPDGDGITLCRDVRRVTGTPVIISSARGDVGTRLQGLHTGADDYLVKPYDLRELVAKVHVLVRRRTGVLDTARGTGPAIPAQAAPNEGVVQVGPVAIDLGRRTLRVNGALVELTAKEFALVALLARAPGVVFSREQILAEVWGSRTSGGDHTLDVHIARVRSRTGLPALIGTVRGVGYRLGIED